MLQDKTALSSYLRKKCNSIVFNKEEFNKLISDVHEQYNIPTGIIADCVSGRTEMDSVSEFILFAIISKLDEIKGSAKTKDFFTKKEIETYNKATYEVETLDFPIVIKCLPVSEDQWIGVTDVKFLMELRKAQLINYNVNAQRTMQRIIRGNKEYYKIALNKNAIREIKDSLHSENYIPNTITLNMDENSNADFSYNANKNELIINSIDHFDISDGYHRYIAMSKEHDSNPDFNYPIEIRIISFPEDKVKQFIFQEDQKTKMSKIDSDSMNMNSAANLVVERLNRDIMFNFKGKISRNEGQINFAELSSVIDCFYFKDIKGQIPTTAIVKTEREIKDYFNNLTSIDEGLMERNLDYKDVIIIVYAAKNGIDPIKATEMIAQKDKLDSRMFKKYRTITKRTVDALDKLQG